MADNKDKIARYISRDMDVGEKIMFEAEMAKDEDLFLDVQLEQIRFNNIHRRVMATLESEELKKTSPLTGKESIIPDANSGGGLEVMLKKIKMSGLRRLIAAAVLVGLAVGAVCFFLRPKQGPNPGSEIATPGASQPAQQTPSPPPDYIRIAIKAYENESPKGEISTAGKDKFPVTKADSAAQAFAAYIKKDSVVVFQYFDTHPNERRAIEWKARFLFEQGRYAEAAPLFGRLATDKELEEFKVIGEWNELLCYAALYPTHNKQFKDLAAKIEGRHHKRELDTLLNQIQ